MQLPVLSMPNTTNSRHKPGKGLISAVLRLVKIFSSKLFSTSRVDDLAQLRCTYYNVIDNVIDSELTPTLGMTAWNLLGHQHYRTRVHHLVFASMKLVRKYVTPKRNPNTNAVPYCSTSRVRACTYTTWPSLVEMRFQRSWLVPLLLVQCT